MKYLITVVETVTYTFNLDAASEEEAVDEGAAAFVQFEELNKYFSSVDNRVVSAELDTIT